MRPFLIVYESRHGQAELIAKHIAGRLRLDGREVDVFDARSAPATIYFARYACAILVASVHLGRHGRAMVRFVRHHRLSLQQLPAAFISVSLTEASVEDPNATDDVREQARREVETMVDRFVAQTAWRPGWVKPVAGALKYRSYGPIARWVMKRVARAAGADTDTSCNYEYTDWLDIDEFVASLELSVCRAAA